MSDNRDRLWQQYKTDGDQHAREQIITSYAYLAKYIVDRLSFPVNGATCQEDLIGHAVVGLIEAVEKFEPERGLKFETFAMSRIRGAVIDALRSLDWAPRSVRKDESDLRKACAEAEAELGRPPTDQELADLLGMDLTDLEQKLALVGRSSLLSLDEALSAGFEFSSAPSEPDEFRDDPYVSAQKEERARLLGDAIDELPERERLVVSLYYGDGLTLKEIAEVLGVTESRVCQLHAKATLRLNGKLTRNADAFALVA